MLGSIPGKQALVEIALCTVVKEDTETFTVLICPDGGPYEYGAMRVLRRSYQEYMRDGIDPRDAAHKLTSSQAHRVPEACSMYAKDRDKLCQSRFRYRLY